VYRQRFKTVDQRFEEKYTKRPNGCWVWNSQNSYPKFWTGAGYEKAGRYLWQKIHKVALASSECVCHHCDNPRCVNPDHLFLGSHTDNMIDKAAKGRTFRGVGRLNGRAVLTKRKADAIRCLYREGFCQDEIAARYGVGQSTVSRIIRGKVWN